MAIDEFSDGIYQCFAANELGTAASDIAVVRKAGMECFKINCKINFNTDFGVHRKSVL